MFATNAPKSVLFVTPQMPSFRGSGLAMRAAATLRLLSLWSRDVHLLVIPIHKAGNAPEPERAVASMVSSWQSLGNQCVDDVAQVSTYWNQALRGAVPAELRHWNQAWQERISLAIAASPAELVVVFRFFLAPYVLPQLKPSIPIWLDVDELESNARARLAKIYAPNDTRAAQSRMEAVAYEKLEKDLLPRFSRLFAASELEANLLRARSPAADVCVLPNSYPLTLPQPDREPDGNARLLFVGTFGYYPNVDAILYFAKYILPIIKERCPLPVETAVIGSGLEAAGERPELPGVNLIGPVSETTPYYAASDAAIVPLRSGAGTRIKILEAFSHQRAVVSTPLGAEGLNLTDNVQLRLAGDAELFAQHCLDLISDSNARKALAQRGHDFFLQHHGPNKLEEMIPALFGAWGNR